MARSLKWPSKDPDERIDFGVDWSDRLKGDAIVSSHWTIPAGIAGTDEAVDGDVTTIWLSGGSLWMTYELLNRIETAAGRTMDQSVGIFINRR